MAILKSIGLNNFRVFKEYTEFELAPITVLTGANNSGKSSILKALLLLQENKGYGGISTLDFNTGRHDLGEFKLIKSGKDDAIEFSFTFDAIDQQEYTALNGMKNCKIVTSYTRSNGHGKLQKIAFFQENTLLFSLKEQETEIEMYFNFAFFVEKEYNRKIKRSDILYSDIESIHKGIYYLHKYQNLFSRIDINPCFLVDTSGKRELVANLFYDKNIEIFFGKTIYCIEKQINLSTSQLFKLDYTSANRSKAQRIYNRENAQQSFETFASYLQKDLYYDDEKVRDFVHFWMTDKKEGLGLIDDLDIFFSNEEKTNIKVRVTHKNMKTDLTEVGFSVAQILPLVVRIAINDTQFALIEEPETNLHPKLQARLADMIIDAYRKFGTRFIVETHSEYFIRKLQFHTANKEIVPSDTVLYYLYDPENLPANGEPQVKRLQITENGKLDGKFGQGFFDESTNLMMDLYKINNNA